MQGHEFPKVAERGRAGRAFQGVGLVLKEPLVLQDVDQPVLRDGVAFGSAFRILDDVDGLALEDLRSCLDQRDLTEVRQEFASVRARGDRDDGEVEAFLADEEAARLEREQEPAGEAALRRLVEEVRAASLRIGAGREHVPVGHE